ncbi:putative ABC transport system ATP-binding protein [Aliiruegeria haliotis]|uniref:Putative ABC transport system ATP-binding protein n=1 Tax=Aliiruegeria haliotis TaxID=1280846 RepID=A0A2T0RV42_9RHOB|nr:ABC transporter ATP-binding protein [Aliiruegeria haliotis]PRY24923.1 putative ABC transport system ATP-binding protein [Aliiruegeria haliotis]
MLIDARDLHKSYMTAEGSVPVLSGVSLTLGAGETLALTGESGSGKSTLLHLIAALDQPDRGEVRLGGTSLTGQTDRQRAEMRRKSVGLVFQQFNLVPSLTVAQNLAFQARLAGRLDSAWLDRLTGQLGLSGMTDRYPEQLSGGQQQRVAIGRALAARPPVLLADEPTGNLDEATADTVLALILELVTETGAGLLLVTHSDRLAGRLSRRLHLRQGHIA